MRSATEHNKIIYLNSIGINQSQISKILDIPRSTIRDHIKNDKNNYINPFNPEELNKNQQKAYSYILGQYLGDGCLSKAPNFEKKQVWKLRIFTDCKHPNITNQCKNSLKLLFPNNKSTAITIYYKNKPSCNELVIYNKQLIHYFPQHDIGKKHEREIMLLPWQENIINLYPHDFIKGLFHSDGCRFISNNRIIYQFTNCSIDIINLYSNILNKLNIEHRVRKKTMGKKNVTQAYNVFVNKKIYIPIMESFLGPKS